MPSSTTMTMRYQASTYVACLAFVLFGACGRKGAVGPMSAPLPARGLEPVFLVPPVPPVSMRWPQFLWADGGHRFLWGANREIYRVQESKNGPVLTGPEWPDLTRGLDRLVSASRTAAGTLALLDSMGRVQGLSPGSPTPWSFELRLGSHAGRLAVTDQAAYLLLQGDEEGGRAVVAYDFAGHEVGGWGEMPLESMIQETLNGGGIAACPDGSIFYSYINGPRIFRLVLGKGHEVRPVGSSPSTFEALSESSVRDAAREGVRSRSVVPIVKLGLSANRVTALLCTSEGLLLRQVARPAHAGGYVEVWDPATEGLIGTVRTGSGVLLDARDHTLYLGSAPDEHFRLDRVEYRTRASSSRGRR